MSSRIYLYVRQHHLGLIAIFIALTGTAYAADKIGSKDIKTGAVKSKQIANEGVKSKDLKDGKAVKSRDVKDGDLTETDIAAGSLTGQSVADGSLTAADIDESALHTVESDFVEAEESTTQLNDDLSGPSVQLEIPPGGMVAAIASALAKTSDATKPAQVRLETSSPGMGIQSVFVIGESQTFYDQLRCSQPGEEDGVQNGPCAPVYFPVIYNDEATTRTYTVRLNYKATAGSTASFRDRRLWAWVVR